MESSVELQWLTVVVAMTGVMWCYVFVLFSQLGVAGALRDPEHDTPFDAPWARRARRAHHNALENLVIFAVLVLVLGMLELSTEASRTAAGVYCLTRLGHFVVYVAGVPWLRTPLFLVGFGAQVVLAFTVFEALF